MRITSALKPMSLVTLAFLLTHCGTQAATKKGSVDSAEDQTEEADADALPKPQPKTSPTAAKKDPPPLQQAAAKTAVNAAATAADNLSTQNPLAGVSNDQLFAYFQTPDGLKQLQGILAAPQFSGLINQMGIPANLSPNQVGQVMQNPDVTNLIKQTAGPLIPGGLGGKSFNPGALGGLFGSLGGLGGLAGGLDFSKLLGGLPQTGSGASNIK